MKDLTSELSMRRMWGMFDDIFPVCSPEVGWEITSRMIMIETFNLIAHVYNILKENTE